MFLDKNDDILTDNSTESQADYGSSSKKVVTQEPVFNSKAGNDFITSSSDGDITTISNQINAPESRSVERRSLALDDSSYVLTEQNDTFTIPSGLLDSLLGGLRALGGADSITGSESGDVIYGDEGDDRIEGLGGADLLYGGLGNDFLSGGAGQNGILGGAGADTLQGGESADGVNGNGGDDVILGAGGRDFLRGGRGNDIVNGEEGDDFVIGDLGNDTLTGGTGQDVFFLRYEQSLGSPTFDLITDFERTIDFIGLSTNLRESDVILESKVQPAGGAAVDIKVAATGTLLGTVLGVTPDDLKGRFRSYDVEPDRSQDVATIDLPEVTKLSDNKFQMEFPASDGSKYTVVFQDDADGRFVESVIFVPNPTTGVRGSTTSLNREGTRADVTLEGSNETLRVESRPNAENGNQDEGVISRIKDGQIIDSVTVPLPIEPTPEPPVTPPTGQPDFATNCEPLKKFCEGTGKVAKVVDFAANVALVTGLLFAAPSGGLSLSLDVLGLGLKGVSTALKVVDYSCKLLTGSDKDLGDAIIDEVSGIGVEKIIKSAGLAKDLEEAVGGTLDLSSSTQNLIDSFGKEKPTEPSKTNFLPQFRKWLADKTGMPFDFCDKPATTPVTPAPTCSERDLVAEITPSVLNYGQTAEVKVTYCDPKNEIDNIHVSLANKNHTTKDIPVSSSSGTVTFGIRNKPNSAGDCDDLGFAASGRLGLSNYLVVSGTSKGSDLTRLSELVRFHTTGGLTQIVTAFDGNLTCDFEFI